ncbi:MAG: guanylate kinase [Selenomonadaceae bacterium]|nr:guanylate kinase [Selenomonadaceae bacterium]MBQ3442661.1 guanylate kinase [Selenomonadaceae bacterium]MBQ6759223.1 guanylate kinase [Selenomonadaceae bacterium]MBR0103329.1 guanylate kinase [Selenomonadaceae bacterium]MBR6713088.1 guanylate kinase [Selenomonadaceae bacterium]
MANNKIYAFLGPHTSGKSTMVSQLLSMGIHYIPTVTTRVFDDRYAYKRKIYQTVKSDAYNREKFIVNNSYQAHSYGLRKSEVLDAYQKHKVSVTIMHDVAGIKQLQKFINQDLVTIFLMIDDEVFVDRMLRAGCSNDEIRYYVETADETGEFEHWRDVDFVVKNTSTARVALEQILAIMGLVTLVPQADFDNLVK